jgi:superfamily II DNA or RNA helicase
MIRVLPVNETYIKILIDDLGIEQEFGEFFTFYSQGYKYAPAYKNGTWDGKIRLFNARNKHLYKGLLPIVIKFARSGNYPIEIDSSLYPYDRDIKDEYVEYFCQNLQVFSNEKEIGIRDYQVVAIKQALQNFRKILISPTGSGKSLIIYTLIRFLLEADPDEKIILIVPTTSLVEQMFRDFIDYATGPDFVDWYPEEFVQLLYSGKDRVFSKRVMISTWQSLHSMRKSDPANFRAITDQTTTAIFDEAHTYKASEVRGTIECFSSTVRRIGTTGTLDGSKVNELVLTGLMGTPYVVKTTRQLIDEGVLSDIKVHVLRLKHPDHVAKAMKGMDYDTEMDFIVGSESRNRFICDLAMKCKGATLITFAYVERHGKVLYEMLSSMAGDRKVYFIAGETDLKEREEVRHLVNKDPNSIVVASEKLFSTGVNIPGLTNIIMAVPRRSPILIRQTIGRGIRKFEGKEHMNLFDIVDDLSVGSKRNITLKSAADRMTIYIKEEFPFKIKDIPLSKYENPSTFGELK